MNELKQAVIQYYTFSDNNNFNLNKLPNRIEIIRDFDHLIEDNQDSFIEKNQENNNLILSQDKLFSKLQNCIFKKITLINDHKQLKNILINDISNIHIQKLNNIYEIADTWCKNKYGYI